MRMSLLATTVVVCAMASPAHADTRTLSMALGTDYAPWVDREMEGHGLATRAIVMAAERGGIADFEVEWVPWSRAIGQVRQGTSDVTFPWLKTEEREAEFLFTDRPLVTQGDYAWTLASTADVNSPDDMAGKTMCIPNGYAVVATAAAFQEAGQLSIEDPPDMAGCFRLLNAGRVDFVMSIEGEALEAMAAAGLAKDAIHRSTEPMNVTDFYALVGKQNPDAQAIIDLLDEGLSAIIDDGSLQALYAEGGVSAGL